MRDADIKSFVSDIASLTGKSFVVDPRVKANVTVISRDDLTIEEAYEIFLSVLSVHGFTAVEQANAVKIVPAQWGGKALLKYQSRFHLRMPWFRPSLDRVKLLQMP